MLKLSALSPYIRLGRFDKPIGIVLILFPCWWGLALATGLAIDPSLMLLYALGATVMRAAGCVINDMADRKFDRQVARTKNRPLANNELSLKQAILFFFALSAIGLWVLLQLPLRCWIIGIAATALLFIYPFAKRFTQWPQFVLGLAFNIGLPMGVATYTPHWFTWPLALAFIGAICWTIAYDTIYALQDIQDDLKIGIGSTAIRFGKWAREIIALFYGLMTLFLLASGYFLTAPVEFYILVPCAGLFILYQLRKTDLTNPEQCRDLFIANQWVGLIVFLAYVFRQPPIL